MSEDFAAPDHATREGADTSESADMSEGAAPESAATGAGGGGTESERLRILQLLEQRKITAAEAAELLAALGGGERAPADGRRRERARWLAEELGPPSDRARWIRVRVTDARTGRVRTNVSVPIGMLGFGLGFARRFRRVPGVTVVDEVFEAVRSGRRGTLFDVANEGGERVEILID